MSNNSFDPSEFPPWLPTLKSLTTMLVFLTVLFQLSTFTIFQHSSANGFLLYDRLMEKTNLQGQIPVSLFTLVQLQEV